MPRIDHPVEDTADTVVWKGPLGRADHSVLRVPDLETALPWYRSMLGLFPIERRGDTVFLASPVSGRTVLGLTQGGTGLEYTSFTARTAESFQAVAAKLDGRNVRTTVDGTTRPGIRDAFRVDLPSGHIFEVVQPAAVEPSTPIAGEYRPGSIDVRTSHLQLRTTDVKQLTDFLGVLGFRSSLYVPLGESDGYYLQFLRVNEFHHQVAILTGREGTHHVALEVDEADFWKFLDNLVVTKFGAEYGPVRHHEGNMLSIYVRDPFGNRLEITSTMEMVGFDYAPHTANQPFWYHMNMWGPQPPETWEQEWM